ncbi:MAG: ABC transporter permease [bacterium]|nr:ABC transporter permease [bacterium]
MIPGSRVLLLSWREGRRSLAGHKLRTALTMLGMIFGVGAVIAMLAIGEGARRQALERLKRLGAENILIEALPADQIPPEDRPLNSPGLQRRDMAAILGLLPDARASASLKRELPLQLGRRRLKGPVRGVDEDYLDLFPGLAVRGRPLAAHDGRHASRVCLLSATAQAQLGGGDGLLGRQVKLGGEWYQVVGVMASAPEGGAAQGGPSSQEAGGNKGVEGGEDPVLAWIPFATMATRHAPEGRAGRVDQVVVRAASAERVAETARLVRAVIERRHLGARDTRLTVPLELIRQQQATQRMFNLVMGAIASISLIVGGIGIMNIMLAGVLERTREIGVRRALGATAAEVELQFLVEAVLISVGGGLAGIALGLALARGISGLAGWETAVQPWSVALAFGVSVLIGLAFGLMPARSAARLDPIEALRHE